MINLPVRHVLLLRLRQDACEEQISAMISALRDLTAKIDGILSFEHGVNNSHEGLRRGMTHLVMFTFASAEARDAYLLHPEHGAVAARVTELGIIEELMAFDYTPQP